MAKFLWVVCQSASSLIGTPDSKHTDESQGTATPDVLAGPMRRTQASRPRHHRLALAIATGALLATPFGVAVAAVPVAAGSAAMVTSSSTRNRNRPASDLFDSSTVHEISVEFDQSDYDAMIEAYRSTGDKEWISATVTIDGTTYENVGLRLKGNSSARRTRRWRCDRRSRRPRRARVRPIQRAGGVRRPRSTRRRLARQPSCRRGPPVRHDGRWIRRLRRRPDVAAVADQAGQVRRGPEPQRRDPSSSCAPTTPPPPSTRQCRSNCWRRPGSPRNRRRRPPSRSMAATQCCAS